MIRSGSLPGLTGRRRRNHLVWGCGRPAAAKAWGESGRRNSAKAVSAGTFSVDKLVTDASPDDYDALLLPGGTVNPDQLRIDPDAVAFVRAFAETGKRPRVQRF